MTTDYENVCAKLKRWRSRLKRAVNTIDKLERQRTRLERKLAAAHVEERTKVKAAHEAALALINEPEPAPVSVPTEEPKQPEAIPDFLRRQKDGERRDAENAKIIKAEQEERRKLKARNRIAEMKAKEAGDLDRMPLSDNAALAAIRS